MECGYLQICMFMWRHFPELVGIAPRKDKGTAKPEVQQINKHSWRRLGQFAKDLGFNSAEISGFADKNPDLGMAVAFLEQARPPDFYNQSKDRYYASATMICRLLDEIEEIGGVSNTTREEYRNIIVPLEYRCGRPYEKSFEESRPRFFFNEIYTPDVQDFSHFALHRDIFRAFFGFELSHLASQDQVATNPDGIPAASTNQNNDHDADPRRNQTSMHNVSQGEAAGLGQQNPAPNSEGHHHQTPHRETPDTLNNVNNSMPPVQGGNSEGNMLNSIQQPGTATLILSETPKPNEASTAVQRVPDHIMDYRKCQMGDRLLVDAETCRTYFFSAEEDSRFHVHIKDLADNYFFARYSNSKKKLVALSAEKALNWRKSTHCDGIVYAFNSGPEKLVSETDIGFTRFGGPDIEACLQQISERFKNKRVRNQEEAISVAVDEYGTTSKLRMVAEEGLPSLPASKRLVQRLALEGLPQTQTLIRRGAAQNECEEQLSSESEIL